MADLAKFVPAPVLHCLTLEEQGYLSEVFNRFNGYPSLEQMWQLMDDQWVALGCDPEYMDERITRFYCHPVWMLNGLFIEQHSQSMENRNAFTDWVSLQRPERVADFSGGFGGLARLIGNALPEARIEIVEPHPHSAAIALTEETSNVRFVPELSGEYDIMIATDVFEHVPDPIGLLAETAAHMRADGKYLIANCFKPVILCHLPQLFYLNIAWESTLKAMGLVSGEVVQYARVYQRIGELDEAAARKISESARMLYPYIRRLPKGRTRIGQILVYAFCRARGL
ncbi:MAG: class I SAM-dependent methyltransferase [Proteobacteria bacterium]|nr:class I SAM-dependent methyltransferase [Pseudomonadota bacterium]